tara:strand:+ start:419 stop:742 length:324 start_codon:yes stop_codon:yes gene_type:complete
MMTFFGALGGYFFKISSKYNSKNEMWILKLVSNPYLYIGGLLYVFSAMINIWLLKFLDYTYVLPLTSITYIWTLLISSKLLEEKISRMKVLGIMSIMFGALLIGFSM